MNTTNWMPIESAPRDGTRVLLFRNEWVENICAGYWDVDYEGWYIVGCRSPWISVSHWMPLPEPPK